MSFKQTQRWDFFVSTTIETISDASSACCQKQISEINAVAICASKFIPRKSFAGCCHPELAGFSFEVMMNKFSEWLFHLGGSVIFVVDSDETFVDLFNQCQETTTTFPSFAEEWLNISKFWAQLYGNRDRVTCDLLLEHFGRNRVLDRGKRTSHSDAQSLSIVIAQVLKAHQSILFVANGQLHNIDM